MHAAMKTSKHISSSRSSRTHPVMFHMLLSKTIIMRTVYVAFGVSFAFSFAALLIARDHCVSHRDNGVRW